MKGYQAAVAVLAVLLVVTVGILFYVAADRNSGSGEAARTAGAPAVTAYSPGTQSVVPRDITPVPASTGEAGDDVEQDIDEEDGAELLPDEVFPPCHACGGEAQVLCGRCGGDGIMPYNCGRCGGDGFVQPSPVDPMPVSCVDCHGTGRLQVPCTECGGDGTRPCAHCRGIGVDPI